MNSEPTLTCFEGQPFGGNYNPSYKAGQLAGHTGEDWNCGYGTPIHSEHDGYVYKVLTAQNPANDGSGFTGVFMIVDNGIESFEYLVGHCNPSVMPGDTIKKGQVIGTEANHGLVYVGNIQITLAMQKAGDERGSHRHYQYRPVKKVQRTDQSSISLDWRDADRNYYQIFNYYNGFNGCISPSAPLFSSALFLGKRDNYQVYCLQRILVKEGVATFEPVGDFGPRTFLAVRALQSKYNLPSTGFVGPLTRKLLTDLITKYVPN